MFHFTWLTLQTSHASPITGLLIGTRGWQNRMLCIIIKSAAFALRDQNNLFEYVVSWVSVMGSHVRVTSSDRARVIMRKMSKSAAGTIYTHTQTHTHTHIQPVLFLCVSARARAAFSFVSNFNGNVRYVQRPLHTRFIVTIIPGKQSITK